MVKHIILWNLKDEYTQQEKEKIKKDIKNGLEGLKGKIPGRLDIRVNIDGLPSSTADLMLDTSFEDEAALMRYAADKAHNAVADTFVRPFTSNRACLDFETE